MGLAVGAPGKSRALDGNGEGELLTTFADGIMFSGGQTEPVGNNFVDPPKNFIHPRLRGIKVVLESPYFPGDFGSCSAICGQGNVFDV